MAIMNSVIYNNNIIFTPEGNTLKYIAATYGVRDDDFFICERSDGKMLAIWSESADAKTYIDIYVCDGAEVNDTLNVMFHLKTIAKKFMTIYGDFQNYSPKSCSCFSFYGKDYLCINFAGDSVKNIESFTRLYSRTNILDAFTEIMSVSSGVPKPDGWSVGNYKACVGDASSNGNGTIIMPFTKNIGTNNYFVQYYSTDYGKTWLYKESYLEIPSVNFGISDMNGIKIKSVWKNDKCFVFFYGTTAFFNAYVFESKDAINWSDNTSPVIYKNEELKEVWICLHRSDEYIYTVNVSNTLIVRMPTVAAIANNLFKIASYETYVGIPESFKYGEATVFAPYKNILYMKNIQKFLTVSCLFDSNIFEEKTGVVVLGNIK